MDYKWLEYDVFVFILTVASVENVPLQNVNLSICILRFRFGKKGVGGASRTELMYFLTMKCSKDEELENLIVYLG